MADFPTLTPTIRPLTPGRWGGATLAAMNGQTSMVRRSSAEIGRRVQLRFENITEAQFLQIVDHYRNQRSGLDGFNFNSATLPTAYTPSGHTWLYAGPPEVVDHHADVFTVAIECRSEPRGPFRVSGVAFTTLPALTAGTPTAIIPGLAITPVESLTAGTITPIVAGAALAVGQADPDFSSVSLLLHMDGSNGSTTFTDSSNNAHAMTVNDGTVTITTAQSKFGGASGEFAGDLRTPTSSTFTFNGAFTIELWARRTGTTGSFDTLVSASSETSLMIRPSSSGPGFFFGGTQFATGLALTLNTWQHVAMVRSGSTVTAYVDGVSIGTITSSSTVTCNFLILGDSSVSGRYFKGQIDELRVTKGLARYTSAFTPPAAAFMEGSTGFLAPGAPV